MAIGYSWDPKNGRKKELEQKRERNKEKLECFSLYDQDEQGP